MFGMRRRRKIISGKVTDRVAGKIVKGISWLQMSFAVVMNKRTRKFSKRRWVVVMVVCGTGWALLSGYLIANALVGQADKRISHPAQLIAGPQRNDSLSYWEEMYKQRKLKK